MDWNWFFSSSAQSAAAIVGIFAAFIITKIVNNQGEFSIKKRQIKKLISNSVRLVDEANTRYFSWYNERSMVRALGKLDDRLDEDHELLTPEQYYAELKFPVFIERGNVLSLIEQKIEQHNRPTASNHQNSPFGISPVMQPRMNIPDVGLINQVTEEKELIDKLVNDTNHHIRDLKNFLDDIKGNPESSHLITFSIISAILLFFVGVIYPLSFLPLEIGAKITISLSAFWPTLISIKGAWLFAVSLIFSLILFVFLLINLKMKYSSADIELLERYSQLSNYLEYFGIMDNNLNGQGQ